MQWLHNVLAWGGVLGDALVVSLTLVGIRYLIYYRSLFLHWSRYRQLEPVTTSDLRALPNLPFIKVQITTRGLPGSSEVICRGIRHVVALAEEDPDLYAPRVSVEVVTESRVQRQDLIRQFSHAPVAVDAIVLPGLDAYQTPQGTQLKARALHYMVELRRQGYHRKPGRTFIVHFDEESVMEPDELRKLLLYLATTGKQLSEGPIYYPLDHCDATLPCRAMEANRPIGCFECRSVMDNGTPLHLHGSNLVVDEQLENALGWDIGTLDGQPFIAEDYIFGMLAYLCAGPHVFGWHGCVMLEQPPLALRSAFRQRYRWVIGVLQGIVAMRRMPEFYRLPWHMRAHLVWAVRYRILTFALGLPNGAICLLFLLYQAAFVLSGHGIRPLPWIVMTWLIFVGWLWLNSVAIGAWYNLSYARQLSVRQRWAEGLAVIALSPIAGILESSAAFWAVAKWVARRREVSWRPTPKAREGVRWFRASRLVESHAAFMRALTYLGYGAGAAVVIVVYMAIPLMLVVSAILHMMVAQLFVALALLTLSEVLVYFAVLRTMPRAQPVLPNDRLNDRLNDRPGRPTAAKPALALTDGVHLRAFPATSAPALHWLPVMPRLGWWLSRQRERRPAYAGDIALEPLAPQSTVRAQPIPGDAPAAMAIRLHPRLAAVLTDEWVLTLLAVGLSVAFYAWYSAHGVTFAFNDARLRTLVARRVLESRTPGLAQLGTTWLPLHFMLMLPLIWNDTLFRDGLAGSFPSMVAYVVATVYMYRTGRLVLNSRVGGWVAATIVMLNPSLLYMQSTAMSETISVCAIAVITYYVCRVTRTRAAADIVKTAAAVAAGTLIRYDQWVLAGAIALLLVYVGWRYGGRVVAEGWMILYGLLAFAGCAGWVVYNAVIFHDPLLAFFYGDSSHTYYPGATAAMLPARHNAVMALKMYGYTVAGTVGWAVLAVACLGLVIFATRMRLRITALPVYTTLVPVAFYWLALYAGVNTVYLPELGQGQPYNIRFGLMMIPAVALFVAVVAVLSRKLAVLSLILVLLTSAAGTVLQTPYVLTEALHGPAGAGSATTGKVQAQWLSAHYRGGSVLITYVNNSSTIFYMLTAHDVPDRALITDANGQQFLHALADPAASATWIVMSGDASNGVSQIWQTLQPRQDWRQYYVLRADIDGTEIYERSTKAAARGTDSG